MQDNNLQAYAKMYCENNRTIFELNENETYREALIRTKTQWTYEILDDISISAYKRAITVRVYLPGEILTGRYVYTETDAEKAHYLAIEDALKQSQAFTHNETKKPQEAPQTQPEMVETVREQLEPVPLMTQEEILNMVLQQNASTVQSNTSITTAEQLNNDTREEIPFEEIQLPESELDKMLSGNAQTSTVTPVTPTSFTQEQIQRMNNFKQKFGIKTDEDFGKFVNAWDKKYTNKRDITPANIESFLKYVEDLGEFPG